METNNRLRKALEKISLLSSAPPPHWKPVAVIVEIGKLADAALAEPVKNCEVGTPAEQIIRFKKFCLDNITENDFGCGDCPCYSKDPDTDKCTILWAQLPYEKGGAK